MSKATSQSEVATYNTDIQLWKDFKARRARMTCGGCRLSIYNGMVGDGLQVLARFPSDRAAATVLRAAGFARHKEGYWK